MSHTQPPGQPVLHKSLAQYYAGIAGCSEIASGMLACGGQERLDCCSCWACKEDAGCSCSTQHTCQSPLLPGLVRSRLFLREFLETMSRLLQPLQALYRRGAGL